MNNIYVFLIRNDVWIYILCVLGLFWYTAELIRAQRGLRSAIFGLERERGSSKRNNALVYIGLFAGIVAVVFFVNRQIAPGLDPSLLRPPTPTPNPLSTPLSRPTDLSQGPTAVPIVTPNLAPTVTLASGAPSGPEVESEEAPTPTATVYVPPTPFVDCTADLNITDPRNGAAVAGDISFFGTADTENFASYVLETNGPQTNGAWASLLGRTMDTAVREGFLGRANLSNWSPGPYLIRLTTSDALENITGACVIQVTLTGS